MKRDEKIAIVRLASDLITADTVIDVGEMDFYASLRDDFRLSRREETEARSISLAEAVATLSGSAADLRSDIIGRCRSLALSDGFCARSEALVLTAIDMTLGNSQPASAEVISVPSGSADIPSSCVVFIESGAGSEIGETVGANYREISSELRLGGFEFVYVPRVIDQYRHSEQSLIRRIVNFISPGLTDEGCDAVIEKLLNMSTAEFTKDILCNKLGLTTLRSSAPALILTIGTSYVNDTLYSNYLKINLSGNVVEFVRRFIDSFTSMLSSDYLLVTNNKEDLRRFIYTGFHKLLLDTHLMRRNVRSRVFINPYKEDIYFPDIDMHLDGLHRREKALYTLLLAMSAHGGVNFSTPRSAKEMDAYRRRMASLRKAYAAIYGMFGGEPDNAPDLDQPELRRPMLSLIKRCVARAGEKLYNPDDYQALKDADGNLAVHLEPELVFVRDYATGRNIELAKSQHFDKLIKEFQR